MDLKQQAEDIVKHCVKLGFPPETLPDKQYIEKISRSRKNALLDNFLQRTETKQKVECIRRNFLIHAAKDERLSTNNLLPLQLQNFLKAMELKRKLNDVNKENENIRRQESALLETIFNKDVRKLKIEKSAKEKEVKCDILQAKHINLNEEITKEEQLEKKVVSVTPPKFAASLKIEDMGKAMSKCLSSLKTFYKCLESSSEIQSSSKMWNEVRATLSDTPNIFMFQSIMKQISANSDVVKQLDASQSSSDSKSLLEQQLLPNLSQRLITSGIELLSMKSKLRGIKAQCSESILSVTSSLEALNNSYNYSFQCDDENLVEDFIAMLLNRLVMQGKIKHGSSVIADLKQRVFDQEISIKDYALTTQDLRNIYSSIDEKVLSVQQGIAQMYHINEKLNFGKISMMHFVQDLKNSSKHQDLNRTMMNLSMSKVSMKEIAIPMHRSELQMFLELPVGHLDFVTEAVACELKRNHLLLISDDESLAVLARRTNCDLSTLNRFLESMRGNLKTSQQLQAILSIVEPKIDIPSELSTADLKKRLEANREAIVELLDQITRTNSDTKILLKEMATLYQYLMTNPLKKFIPSSRKFDGKSFKEFENVFNLYYKMIRD